MNLIIMTVVLFTEEELRLGEVTLSLTTSLHLSRKSRAFPTRQHCFSVFLINFSFRVTSAQTTGVCRT